MFRKKISLAYSRIKLRNLNNLHTQKNEKNNLFLLYFSLGQLLGHIATSHTYRQHTHTCTHPHTGKHIHTHACMHTCTYACIHTCTHASILTCIHTCTYMHAPPPPPPPHTHTSTTPTHHPHKPPHPKTHKHWWHYRMLSTSRGHFKKLLLPEGNDKNCDISSRCHSVLDKTETC